MLGSTENTEGDTPDWRHCNERHFDHIGWWILAVVPAAIVINLALTVTASNIWPHCKKCGAGMIPTNYEVGRGTEDQGFVVIATCPNKCPK